MTITNIINRLKKIEKDMDTIIDNSRTFRRAELDVSRAIIKLQEVRLGDGKNE